MSETNMVLWDKVRQPPASALKTIGAGRLKGKTDINPQWRYKALTEQFGICGFGWKYEVTKLWNETLPDGQILAFANIFLYIKQEAWSEAIPGTGGSMLITKESTGLHASDEGYKMAITDALSVACKVLGIGADVYAGKWDGSKYSNGDNAGNRQRTSATLPPSPQKATSKPVVTHRASGQEGGEVDIPQFEDSKHMMGWLCSKTSLDFKGITAKAEQDYKELKTQEDMLAFAKKVINE